MKFMTQNEKLRLLMGMSLFHGRYSLRAHAQPNDDMIVAYEAVDATTGQDVIVRVIVDDRCLGRIRNEVNLAWAFQRPNFAAVLHANLSGEMLPDGTLVRYVVTRRVGGVPLRAIIRDNVVHSVALEERLAQAAAILTALAPVLDALHRTQIVHTNLHPGSILLQQDTAGQISTHLVNLGLAVQVGAPRSDLDHYISSTNIAAADHLANPAYMPPEQWANAVEDGRSDQYSVAVLLYELSSNGASPYQKSLDTLAGSERAIESTNISLRTVWRGAHERAAPTPLSDYAPDVLPEVWDVLRRALEKSPEQRYTTMDDFAKAFTSAVEAHFESRGAGQPASAARRLTALLAEARSQGTASRQQAATPAPVRQAKRISRLNLWRLMLIGLLVILSSSLLVWLMMVQLPT